MTEETKESFLKGVDLHCKTNNPEHHTSEISLDKLIVRRGQPFMLTVSLTEAFNPVLHPLHMVIKTGDHSSEELGTMSYLSVPAGVERSPSAKAAWKVEFQTGSSLLTGVLDLKITPPADAPVGEYILCATYKEEKMLLAMLVVLFNPWCPDDLVYMVKEEEKQEYVMNEQGIIYKGSGNYISPIHWDFGQFEDAMVEVCVKLLDLNIKNLEDAATDVSARSDPIYVSRVVSAMINSEDDNGVLEGRWGGPYYDGVKPSHWNGSHSILKQWLNNGCEPVKYGQCWVFAGVMCSVMRLLGIPCRVVTNFESAHDCNRNLIIDVYHANYGVKEKESPDSVWNFHVWTEGWMKRPDLGEDGKYDGWQVLDPTPQEISDGLYCCGPAPVKAILEGQTDLKYDIPFVFAEVNADCIDWLVNEDSSMVKIWSDSQRVGQNISTKSVGSNKRLNITDTYKHREGTEKERTVFKYACTRDYSRADDNEEMEDDNEEDEIEEDNENEAMEENAENANTEEAVDNAETESNHPINVVLTVDETPSSTPPPPPPPITIEFKEVNEDSSMVKIWSDSQRVGQNISTKSVGSNKRLNITDTYKHREGTEKERTVFKYACTRDYSRADDNEEMEDDNEEDEIEEDNENEAMEENAENANTEEAVDNAETESNHPINVVLTVDETPSSTPPPPPPPITIEFKEVSKPVNGKDVRLKLVLHSKSSAARKLSVNIGVQAMTYNGLPAVNIQSEVKEMTLQPGKDLSIPIVVPFLAYHKPMVDCDSMKISAVVKDKQHTYLAEDDVVLLDPPISVTVNGEPRLYQESSGEVVFDNPANEMLTNCTLTLSGSGLWRDDREYKLQDMKPSTRIRIKFFFVPYKTGEKTLVVDFDCNTFRDIKGSCTIKVTA